MPYGVIPGGKVEFGLTHKVNFPYTSFPKSEFLSNTDTQGLQGFTPNTICTADVLFEELVAIRSRGYAIDNSEHERHIRCTFVPILNGTGKIKAALSITGTVFYFPDDHAIRRSVNLLEEVRDKIRIELGYANKTS